MCSYSDESARRSRLIANISWRRIQPAFIDGAVFGERSLPAHQALIRSPHPIADFASSCVGANRFDRACQITTDDEGLRQLPVVRSVTDVSINGIQRDCADFDQNLRSLRLGLLSIIPNFVPIAALIGTMGYLDIPLNSFNSMVASIAIGIAVDDTIHLLTGFKRFSAEMPRKAAV